MALGSFVVDVEGMYGVFLSVPLPLLTHRESNHIIVTSRHMFTLVGRLLG